MRKFLAGVLALVLAGCTSAEQFKSNADSYIGSTEANLIAQMGPPANAYDAGGTKFLSWSWNRNVPVAGVAPTYQTSCYGYNCTTTAYGGTPNYNVSLNCTLIFAVEGGIVKSWRSTGNNCRS